MNDNEYLVITPRTKVLKLIETYPQLEEKLIAFVPAFKKLKNPVLRNTVAKITSLQQAAMIGKVEVEELINMLRGEVGQDVVEESEGTTYNTKQPDWFDENKIHQELLATEMLASGEHPVNQVMADLKILPEGSIYKLVAPFLPAPLIDKAVSLGFQHWVNQKSEEEVVVYFYKS